MYYITVAVLLSRPVFLAQNMRGCITEFGEKDGKEHMRCTEARLGLVCGKGKNDRRRCCVGVLLSVCVARATQEKKKKKTNTTHPLDMTYFSY